MAKPISILVCALGGEGGGVLAEWLYAAAVRAGHAAQSTSIPGVAQRTGATTYYLEIAATAGHPAMFSLSPVPGEIDLLVSSELLETVRQVGLGFANAERTLIISALARVLTVAEKAVLTDGRSDSAALMQLLQHQARATELLDLAGMARHAGTVISSVMLGAIAASGVLPRAFTRDVFEDTIRAGGVGVDGSLRGFALAFERVATQMQQREQVAAALKPAEPDLLALARARLADYQDAAYVRLYDERLAQVSAAEGLAGPITQEMTRWLALWMAFDDIVRVAQLKLARTRQARIRHEVGARDDEIVKTFDHFKPGASEFAALLPQALAQRLLAWDRRRVQAGREPWAWAIQLGTHTVFGALTLKLLASLRGQRRRGQRFALEQQLLDEWLASVVAGTRDDVELGLELAKCGRLIKGYGSTNERGKENLLHIVRHLARSAAPATERAAAVRAAREAALADDAGIALDITLQAHGAPARPAREQTIRWHKRKPAATV